MYLNLTGWKLASFGETATLSISAPSAQIKVVTNFGGDFYGSLGANAIGFAFVNLWRWLRRRDSVVLTW